MRAGWFRRHAGLLLLLAAYVGLAAFYSIANPLFEAPDEVWHFEYARWIAEGKGLAAPDDVGVAAWAQEGSQPPLYYLMNAALIAPLEMGNAAQVIRYNPHAAVGQGDAFGNRNMMVHDDAQAWPWRGVTLAAHLTRLFSVLLGAATVTCTWWITRRLLPGLAAAPLIAAAFVAFNPQFLFIHASTTNDALVTAVCAATLALLVSLLVDLRAPTRGESLLLGLLVGAAALSKLSGLLIIVPLLCSAAWIAWRGRAWRALWRAALLPLVVAALVAGWWYARNLLLFGDPLALDVMFAVLPGRAEPAGAAQLLALAPGVWRSLWGVFGWFNVPADAWLAVVFSILVGVGLLVAGGDWLRGIVRGEARPSGAAIGVLWLWIALVAISLVRWAQISYPQGRLLFPALPALACFVGWGWAILFRWVRLPRAGPVALAGALACVALVAPGLWIRPAYEAIKATPGAEAAMRVVDTRFGEGITLEGYTLGAERVRAGEPLDVTLYWRTETRPPGDYSVFVHATDSAGILQTQRDSFPGQGANPTSAWQPGTRQVDVQRLDIPATILATDTLTLTVGLYDPMSGQRLLASDGADAVTIGPIDVTPAAERPRIDFGGTLALADWSLERASVAPGETLAATLTWQALTPPTRDYVIFAHLVRPPGEVWAQEDDQPDPRTSTWSAGQVVTVRHELRLPAEAPQGDYQVEIGVYDAETLERLPVEFSDAGVVIGKVRVEAAPP